MLPKHVIALSSAAVVLWASGALAGSADHTARQLVLEKEATELIERVEEVGRDVQYHSERLNDLSGNPGISPWSHYHHMDGIKAEVNSTLRPALKRLAEIEKELPEWKQESVARMVTAAQALSADMSHAFATKTKDIRIPAAINDAYKGFVREVMSHAASLVTTAEAAHDYAVAHRKAVEAGLPVGASSAR